MTSCNQQAQNKGEEQSVGRLVYLTSLKLRNYAEKILSPHDLTVEQFHLLKNTSRVSGLSQNELCRSVGKKPANITRILDRLEKKKWIERRVHPNDRRATLVFLTRDGELIVKKVSSTFESYSSRFIAGVDADEERIFRQVIKKINGNIDRLMNEITG
ncbi:MAG: MarR family transcriptional regulator [Desulfocapsaceae bacterium]|nr:MarR family transcriptional regulator [Desulfocapsaceae bacterium]